MPGFLGFAGERAFFEAYTPAIGQELWSTDGTPEGTRLVGDRCAGECDSFFTPLAQTNDRLFVAVSAHHSSSSPQEILALGGESPEVEVVFANSSSFLPYLEDAGTTALLGDALIFWTTDFNSTTRLYSAAAPALNSLCSSSWSSQGISHASIDRVRSSISGTTRKDCPHELWSTDGTPGGTHRITTFDFEGVDAVEVPTGDRNLLFSAVGANGSELWFSDGTAGGTYPLSSFTDPEARIWSLATSSNGAVFLVEDASFGQELWTTDDTAGGTRAVTSFGFHAPFGEQPEEATLFAAGGRVYFFASNGIDRADLWVTSPSGASASTLMQICQEAFCYQDRWLVSVGSQVFFAFADPEHGRELWTTDGTPSGTRLFADICPDACSGFGEVLASSAGRLAFTAVPGPNEPQTLFLASAPWFTVATLWDPLRGAPTFTTFAERSAIDSGERLYFAAQDSLGGTEPWVSEGSPSSTLQLVDIWGTEESGSRALRIHRGGQYRGLPRLRRRLRNQRELLAERRDLSDDAPGERTPQATASRPIYPLESLPDRLVTLDCWGDFLVVDPAASSLSLIPSGDCLSSSAFGAVGGLAAAALWCPSGTQIWKSDGTVAGTSSTLTLPEGFGIQAGFSTVGSHLLFAGGGDDVRLYSMPGSLDAAVPLTAPGTYFESLIAPENERPRILLAGHAHPSNRRNSRRNVSRRSATRIPDPSRRTSFCYWLRPLRPQRIQFLRGMEERRDRLRHARPGFDRAGTTTRRRRWRFDRAGDDLYFILGHLWRATDALDAERQLHTAARAPCRASPPGVPAAHFSRIAAIASTSRGCDANHGCELWVHRRDRSRATRMLQDIYAWPRVVLSGRALRRRRSLLYFSADDGLHGFEPGPCRSTAAPPAAPTSSLSVSRADGSR